MIRTDHSPAFRLAAIDLDGTLLGPGHQISEANARAVRALQAGGAQVVLASGRHYNSMLKYAHTLPGVQWIVSCQGGEVSDVSRAQVLSRSFLPPADAQHALSLGQSLGFTPVAYTVEGVFTTAARDAEIDFYTDLAGHKPEQVSASALAARDVFKVIWMGDPQKISDLALPPQAVPPAVETVRTHARFMEFVPAGISKGSALAALAARLGIPPADAVVFGDGENDIPMFDWAGASVAMPHGWARRHPPGQNGRARRPGGNRLRPRRGLGSRRRPPSPGRPRLMKPDSKKRCSWAENDPVMRAYHDEEWGVPVRDSRALWEMLMLEGFQAGLSWSIILRRRPAFRRAFQNFDPAVVERFGRRDINRLVADATIIRSRAKIEATIGGARALSRHAGKRRGFRRVRLGLCGRPAHSPHRREHPGQDAALRKNLA